jgi:hypothetical protein
MMSVHLNGWTKTILDKDERDSVQLTMYYTFKERFDAVCELLKVRFPSPIVHFILLTNLQVSKTTCRDLMKGHKTYAIIGNPRLLIDRSATNEQQKKGKAHLIAAGTKLEKMEKEQTAETMERGDQDNHGDDFVEEEEELRRASPPSPEKLEKTSSGKTRKSKVTKSKASKGRAAKAKTPRAKKRGREEDSKDDGDMKGDDRSFYESSPPPKLGKTQEAHFRRCLQRRSRAVAYPGAPPQAPREEASHFLGLLISARISRRYIP